MTLTAAQIGGELTRYVQNPATTPDDAEIVRLFVDRLLIAEGLTALDALAFVSLAESLTRQAASRRAETTIAEVRVLLDTAARLQRRAVETLERLTGYAADGFSGETRTSN